MEPRQMDAIREVVSIGAGHAATALSEMTGLRVMISVPRARWLEGSEGMLPGMPMDDCAVMVSLAVEGVAGGSHEHASLILSRETVERMVGLLLRREISPDAELGPLERSTLMELGNIVCASYVGVLGNFLGSGMMIGPPALRTGAFAAQILPARSGLMIETDFIIRDASFEGLFILHHSEMGFAALLAALGMGPLPGESV